MLSRVADSVYWMSRYVERVENLARFIDVTHNLILDQPSGGREQWAPLVHTTGDQDYFKERYGHPSEERAIRFLTFDADYPGSIVSSLAAARENARSICETISSAMWESINEFYHMVQSAARSPEPLDEPSDFFRRIRRQSQLFFGVAEATMARDEAWHFANVGRLIERADKTSRILDVKYFTLLPRVTDVGTPIDDLQWSAVLRSVSGFQMYRKRHQVITVKKVVEFLVLDQFFPRSIQFCLLNADESLHRISGMPVNTFCNDAEQRLGRLRAELVFSDVSTIVDHGLHEFIDALQMKLNLIGQAISYTFFGYERPEPPEASRQTQSQTSNSLVTRQG